MKICNANLFGKIQNTIKKTLKLGLQNQLKAVKTVYIKIANKLCRNLLAIQICLH
jgi:hypothetical protein